MDAASSLSLVTTTHNNFTDRGGTLPMVIETLSRQHLPSDSELVIVDDGSTDRTGEYLDNLDGETIGENLKINVCRLEHTGNRARGRNAGIDRASADLLLLFDADTAPIGDDCIQRLLQVKMPDNFVCGARCYWSPPDWDEEVAAQLISNGTLDAVREWGHLPMNAMSRTEGRRALQEYSLLSNFGLVSRDDLRQVGYFDESFERWGYETRDLTSRLLEAGLDMVNVFSEAAVLHFNHPLDVPGGGKQTNRKLYHEKQATRGIRFDAAKLFTAPEGDHDDILKPIAGREEVPRNSPVSITRPIRLDAPPRPRNRETPGTATVRRRNKEDTELSLADATRYQGRISAVISTANSFRDRNGSLELVLTALENQRTTDFEVIVVDDGSTDRTVRFLDRFAAETELDLTVVRFDENSGNRSKARNRGAECADGDLLLFIDDDTVPLSDTTLEEMRMLYEPNTFLCGARRRWTDSDWHRPTIKFWVETQCYDRLRDVTWVPRGISRRQGHRSLWEVTHLTNFGLVSKQDFQGIGGFDADTFNQWGREDIDLMARLYLDRVGFVNLYDFVSVIHLNHPLKRDDQATRETAFEQYTRKEREEYGYEFDLSHLYDVTDEEGTVIKPVRNSV